MGFLSSLFGGGQQPATTAANAPSPEPAAPKAASVSPAPAQAQSPQQGGASGHVDVELDARGLNCPLPILKTKKALAGMASGQVLKVISTDCGSVKDMESFSSQTGNPLLEQAENDGEYIFFMQKK